MQKNSGSAVLARQLGCGRSFHTRPISLKNYIKSHSVRYWEPDWLFRFTIVFQLNNGKNIWSSLKMQWQLPHLTNDYIVWPWSAKQSNFVRFSVPGCFALAGDLVCFHLSCFSHILKLFLSKVKSNLCIWITTMTGRYGLIRGRIASLRPQIIIRTWAMSWDNLSSGFPTR